MGNVKWVRHISGQGDVWRVKYETLSDLAVCPANGEAREYMFPKSEYYEVPGPERWVDVTDKVVVVDRAEFSELVCDGEVVKVKDGAYRLRKVPRDYFQGMWAFIVEKKEP